MKLSALLVLLIVTCSSAFAVDSTGTLTPTLQCTAKSGAFSYTSYFGYSNTNASSMILPVSASNTFTTAPANQGQPTTFLPGVHNFAFSINHSGNALSWFLLGRTASASSSVSQRCQSTCSVPSKVTISSCQTSAAIDGSNSKTLNNNGIFSSVNWTTNCPAFFTPSNSLSTTLKLNSLYTGPKFSCSATLNLVDNTIYFSENNAEVQERNCSTEVVVEQCVVDCKGVPSGTTKVDACGVCGGDGSTCKDCKGTVNGKVQVDRCGVCGGDGTSCLDCKGVVNGNSIKDLCGVCGGNNSTCSDCAGVPNGKTVADKCGVCGGNGSTCGGTVTKLDECGVSGGDNSTCKDCAGIPNGSSKVDACGVCGGDGSSCVSCSMVPSADLKNSKFLSLVRELQSSSRRYIGEATRCSKKNKKQMTALLKQSESLSTETIKLALESFVEPAAGCVGASICTLTVSLTSVKKTLEKNIKTIRDLTKAGKKVVATCRKPMVGTAKGSKDVLSETTTSLKALPNVCKVCP